jgi:hypothetical protein
MAVQIKAWGLLHLRRLIVGGAPGAVDRGLLSAPADDEPDREDADGGLTEARQELARGEGISTEELRRELGLE